MTMATDNVENDDLKFSLLHLNILNNNIENCIDGLEALSKSNLRELNPNAEYIIISSTVFFSLLKGANYLDEVEKQLFEILEKRNQIDLKEKITVIIKFLFDKWKDLTNFRNHILAHNFRNRNKKYESIFKNSGYKDYEIPLDLIEVKDFYELINKITNLLKEKFPEFFSEFNSPLPN